MDYARPPEPNWERALKFMFIGVVVAWFPGIILGLLFMWETEVREATLYVGIVIAIATLVGGGWIGWLIGLKRSN